MKGAGSAPSLNVSRRRARSGGSGDEAVDELVEDGLEAGSVVVGVGTNDIDYFAVAVSRLTIIASGLVDHAEAIPAIVNIREAFEQIAGHLLGLIEAALVDEIDGSVGCDRELVFGIVYVVCGGEPVGDFLGDVADVPPCRRCGGGVADVPPWRRRGGGRVLG